MPLNHKHKTSQASSSLVEILLQRAQNQPERKAYIFLQNGETESGSLTYGELDRQARAIAAKRAEFILKRFCLMSISFHPKMVKNFHQPLALSIITYQALKMDN